jgi:hypothetical protein
MRIIVNSKTMVADEAICCAFTGMNGNGSVTFLADIPKNAIVVDVLVNGKSLESYRLAEYRNNGIKDDVIYPTDDVFEERKVVAVYIDETCGSGELYNLVFSGEAKSLAVKYIETATAEV